MMEEPMEEAMMDQPERRRFLAALRRDGDFRADVRRELLTEELLAVPEVVAMLVDVVAEQRRDFTNLTATVHSYMERTIAAVQEGFTAVRNELTGVRDELTGVRDELTGVRDEVTGLRGEVTGLRGDMNKMEFELRRDMTAGFASIDARLDQLEAEIRRIGRKRDE